MGFNADGTYTDPSSSDGSGGTPAGTGDNGEVWDPITKRWVPRGQGSNQGPALPEGPGGWSNLGGSNYGGPSTFHTGGPDSTGKAASEGAWGGYSGRFVDDGQGGLRFDGTHSGRQDDVDHLSGLAGAAMNQAAYQNDYRQADKFAGLGQGSRGYETDALGLAGQTARGENLQSMKLGQSMLQQGLQAQQAGAAGARGGSLAQAVAARQAAAGVGSYMANGNAQLEAQRAAEMANGRDMFQQQAGAIRGNDATAQGLNQQQALARMQNELAQRQLNQKGQMGYDSLAQDVNVAASNAALGQHEQNAGIDDKSMQRHQNKLDQGMGWVGDAAAAAGSVGGKVAGMTSGGSGGGDVDPYSKAVSNSDVRSKMRIHNLSTAVMARKAVR